MAYSALVIHDERMEFSNDPRIAVWEKEMARIEAGKPPPHWENPPRRHHYVPEMYLKRFSAPMTKKHRPTGRVARIELKLGPASRKVIGIHDAAVETDFYNVEVDDPRGTSEAEHLIGVFETAAGYALANFDKGGRDHFPDALDRQNLSLFMALQFVRGPDTGDFLERALTEVSRMSARVAAAHPSIVRKILEDQGREHSADAVAIAAGELREASQVINVRPHQNHVVTAVLNAPAELMHYFFCRHWAVVRSRAPFLTTDRPIALLGQALEPWGGIGVGTADAILFVVDRFRALYMQHPLPEHHDGLVEAPDDMVRKLNGHIANRARRWIFHHPDDEPLAGLPFDASWGTRQRSA